jgi:serpin B
MAATTLSKLRRWAGMAEPRATSTAEGMNRFALQLYAAVQPTDNFAFSPASVFWALSMSLVGASGATAEELSSALGVGDAESLSLPVTAGEACELAIANGVFSDRSVELLATFVDRIAATHGGVCAALDFAKRCETARVRVNEWVAEATKGKIQDLLSPGTVSSETRLVLVNAVYFKAAWLHRFPEDTADGPFTLASGECVQVPMMRTTGRLPVADHAGASVVELPYQGGEMSMAIVLPSADSSLEQLEARATADVLARWLSRLRERQVLIELPRFTIDGDACSLAAALAKVGVVSLFDAQRCDWSKATRRRIHVEDVVHKTYLRVTEEGTEAAAATAMLAAESKPPKRRFVANRPFLFLIRDQRDGSILFLGRVTDPRSPS